MAYTITNFKTKKALKEALEIWSTSFGNKAIRCYQPGRPDLSDYTGKICIEGPHWPKAHTWYAQVQMKDGIVVKVK